MTLVDFDMIELDNCVEIIKNGGIILYPTDTIYGLGCDSHNIKSINKINKLKGSNTEKPLIYLMNSLKMLEEYVIKIPEFAKDFLLDENPTTVIFNDLKKNKLSKNSIAVRIPKNRFCLKLISAIGRPITSTSANLSGSPFPRNMFEIEKKIIDGVNYFVKASKDGELKPSKIIKLTGNMNYEIIRK